MCMRTMKELASEVIQVQNDLLKIEEVANKFNNAMTDMRALADMEGWFSRRNINQHPICILYADKMASLTGINLFDFEINKKISAAYDWVYEVSGEKRYIASK